MISSPSPKFLHELAQCGVATVHEAMDRSNLLPCKIKPLQSNTRICGPAVTVQAISGDNLALREAFAHAKMGDVLVVTTDEPKSKFGMFGDMLGLRATQAGLAGIVLNSGVRDTQELKAMNFPVWSRYICAQGTSHEKKGTINQPIDIEGVKIHPGDLVVADDDGVCIVPKDDAEVVKRKAQERIKEEHQARLEMCSSSS